MHDRSALQVLSTLLEKRLKTKEQDQGGQRAKPNFQNDHDSTPARNATQRNQTHPAPIPQPMAHRPPLMT
ncbi:hypothetical protein BLA18628_03324 [Burkholderia aenigmatica]|nr:hypothetical protein BLA18628_03324 [Burkholderia aenigmatica]